MHVLLVAVAGGLGAAARYLLGLSFGGGRFPWATLGINLTGSLLLGALLAGTIRRELPPVLVTTLGVGFLGGFTTFSTFSVETVLLLRDGRLAAALGYLGVSVVGGLCAAALGYVAIR